MAEKSDKDIEFEGFKFKFNPDVLDDMEFLELSERVEKGDLLAYPSLVKILLGEETYDKAKAYFTEKYGRFTATKSGELFNKTLATVDPKE